MIEMLQRETSREALRQTRALILLPTRELAMQVHEQYQQLRSKGTPKAALVIGGVSEKSQIQGLRAGAGLIIATPGRLQDLLSQRLVFTRTKRGAQRLAQQLVRDGFTATMIHGDRSQSQRNGALNGFQEGCFQVLVATDIASRGLHVDDVAHVINYDLPKMAEDFIHRVGRTGRAGLRGQATTLVAAAEVMELRTIERKLQLRIERMQLDGSGSSRPKPGVQNTL